MAERKQEIWRDVPGHEGLYQVSNQGNVRSIDRIITDTKRKRLYKGKQLKLKEDYAGYLCVILYKNSVGQDWKVHRAVALAFLPNPEHKRVVNHIDGNKQNNCVENLEWATHSENARHAYTTGLRVVSEKQRASRELPTLQKAVFGTKDGIRYSFRSIHEAARLIGGNESAISQCCKGKRKTHRGYEWVYAADGGKSKGRWK